MNKLRLGNSNIETSPIVFGGNVFGWTADETRSFTLLDALLDLDITMIDTANVYSAWVPGHQGGESETIIGKWLKKSNMRDRVTIASKVGMDMPDGTGGLSKANIIASAEASLRRLNTDYIDVFYAHRDDQSVPVEETLSAFEELIKTGKVRAIASSNYSGERLTTVLDFARENGLPQYIAHQPEYNLFDRQGYEQDVEKACISNELGVVTYFSLASGFLSGKYKNETDLLNSNRGKEFLQKYMTPRGINIVATLSDIARIYEVPAACVALRWIIQRPSVTAPIVSATSVAQLKELSLVDSFTLSDNDMSRLDNASNPMK